ncbi:hypothetical protein SAMD00019534_072170 [Acytostelium subglobosum LB1]|uniref:hypothetical protein n=1 Tax=Acytostelium subglobosum LB1 TaxID=1410327 RepID=UPI0006451BC7|nr:hypothetical protein SAMD00019534_072170 [Acytostelium subglobosum LB1]GAM24042.1 hypothetical protein SAMD00019534_072170 [Acytostelium subglobosum LB1]|eukprot:XP_012753078.1 hypothetical protein SAMD00019534_072170 [Acytostelium subglobosum LB1]
MKLQFNTKLQPLQDALAKCDKGALFCVKGQSELAMPRIEVSDVGVLSFPVTQDQLKKMVERATRAPYGKGTETITDLNVRRVWQIQNADINISGEQFNVFFNAAIKHIKDTMGLAGETVTAELYKMLIYDKGGFFLPHRDSEKAANMFGTLVLSLPCSHRGGDLFIAHSGKQVVVSLENDTVSSIKWTAFFADCRHEVKPVTEGNRVCLVYNLMRSGGHKLILSSDSGELITNEFNKLFCVRKAKKVYRPKVVDDEDDDDDAVAARKVHDDDEDDDEDAKVLKKAKTSPTTTTSTKIEGDKENDDDGDDDDNDEDIDAEFNLEGAKDRMEKIVYTLQHVYSMANFTLESLKGNDAVLARALLAISDKAQIKIGLAFIHLKEEGGYSNEYGGPEYYNPEAELTLEYVKDIETDEDMDLDEDMTVEESEILPKGRLDNIKPYEEEAEEATGNEGGTYEKLYRHSALVIWSTAYTGVFTMVENPDVVFQMWDDELEEMGGIDANPRATLELFFNMLVCLNKLQKSPQQLESILAILGENSSNRYLPKLISLAIQSYGPQFSGRLHGDILIEILLDPSLRSMTPDTVSKTITLLLRYAPPGGVVDLWCKMLEVPNPPEHLSTLQLHMVHQLKDKIFILEQCDKLIQALNTHAMFAQERQKLVDMTCAKATAIMNIEMAKGTFPSSLKEIERLLGLVATGVAPSYVSLPRLKELFKMVVQGSPPDLHIMIMRTPYLMASPRWSVSSQFIQTG